MTLIELIKTEHNRCRTTNKDAALCLGTFIAECEKIGKDDGNRQPTDSEVTSMLQKFIKNIDECLTYRPDDEKLQAERKWLEVFLPKQLTEDEIVEIINTFIDDNNLSIDRKHMGAVMKYFRQNYEGCFDGALVSRKVREILK